MEHIEKPAYRITIKYIWNSFRSSHKKHLLLTGSRGSGKTTLYRKLLADGQEGGNPPQWPCSSREIALLTTWAVPRQGVFMKNGLTGETKQVGRYAEEKTGGSRRMEICKNAFSAFGRNALLMLEEAPSAWVGIDEIGYLECDCDAYCHALREVFEKKHVLAVIRKDQIPFLQELLHRKDAFVVDLDDPFGHAGCVIMASGMSRRFGRNKLLEPICEKAMIEYILQSTDGVFHQRVVVTRHAQVEQLCRQYDIPAVLHDLPYRSDTVRLGCDYLKNMDRIMFCPSDQPALQADTIMAMLLYAQNHPERISRVCAGDRKGAPVLFPDWTFDMLRHLPEGEGGSAVLQVYPERVDLIEAGSSLELMDVDTPMALELMTEAIRKKRK